ncbi:hypothetical protein RFI_17237 [Reticulomyxa filosa]|uniref:Uncharacterized protein n=1 Tax=Reticulomyxa filosa TaxID=46433 RepID=X6N3U9_RETFI|nr:hypothetical protein RFI_17237 [Reticulomyxa filosa]|eukprot:ETO19982.1 hypothetical protein RFI_17237 [Reticulomyxa filosa]
MEKGLGQVKNQLGLRRKIGTHISEALHVNSNELEVMFLVMSNIGFEIHAVLVSSEHSVHFSDVKLLFEDQMEKQSIHRAIESAFQLKQGSFSLVFHLGVKKHYASVTSDRLQQLSSYRLSNASIEKHKLSVPSISVQFPPFELQKQLGIHVPQIHENLEMTPVDEKVSQGIQQITENHEREEDSNRHQDIVGRLASSRQSDVGIEIELETDSTVNAVDSEAHKAKQRERFASRSRLSRRIGSDLGSFSKPNLGTPIPLETVTHDKGNTDSQEEL